jgi:hypothetical protein
MLQTSSSGCADRKESYPYSLVAMKEEDQLFLDPAEWQLEREQRAILTQLGRLTPVVKGLAVLSTALLVLIAGVWIYQGVLGTATSTLRP